MSYIIKLKLWLDMKFDIYFYKLCFRKEQYQQYSPESLVLNGFGMMVIVFLFLIIYTIIKTNKH
jgi:hypothetical protein